MSKVVRIPTPKTLDDIVLADEYLRDDLQDYCDGYETGTLLFSGTPGSGKSTLARVIADTRCGVATYINATDKEEVKKLTCDGLLSKVDFQHWMEDRVEDFVPTLFIDEVDRLDDVKGKWDELKELFDILERNKHDEYWQWNVLLTTNHLNKLPDALRSRCEVRHIRGLTAQDAVPAVQRILQQQGIVESDANVLRQIELGIKAHSANNTRIDWRRVVSDCQRKVRRHNRTQAQQQTTKQKTKLRVVK